LRHELFDTPVTVFPEDSRAVPFDELLQYATNISRHTVPPTYRERVPAADKEKEDDELGSGGAPTNGLNTPALAPDTMEPPSEATQGHKEGEDAAGPTLEITPEEEEWLKKLKASNLPWYPWPSNDKIRAGALHSLQYWREVSFVSMKHV
jgi:ubiquitin carboxyl-terminal hydrolase 5/13